MHSPEAASAELRRCVEELGFKGVLINGVQRTSQDGKGALYYDNAQWDSFWSTCEELDVPAYMHPRDPIQTYTEEWKDRDLLLGPPMSFAHDCSLHVMGMIANGVFDRHPRLQYIIGHMGEKLPADLWRINYWFHRKQQGKENKLQRSVYQYFSENIWITTSGNFSTPALELCCSVIGPDRIMFSVDFPYQSFEDGCPWFDNLELSLPNKLKIGRENAKKLFKLSHYRDSEAPVTA